MTALCKQAAHSTLCCWGFAAHGAATHAVVVAYADRETCEHHVCEGCATLANTGVLPEQHDDGVADLVTVLP